MESKLFFVAVLGLILGSFLSVLMERLFHNEKGILWGRSRCPSCKKILGAQDLIPLFSYLGLRGRCRFCKEKISSWYPGLELASMGIFLALFWKVQNVQLFLWFAPHFFVLLFIFFFDLRYKAIDDRVLIPGIVYAFIANFFIGNAVGGILGAAVGTSFFGLQYLISRGRWIGSGDLRIGAFLGFFLGWPMTLLAILLGYILGSLVSLYMLATKMANPKTAVPLGPFLVTGSVLAFFFGEQVLELYFSFL